MDDNHWFSVDDLTPSIDYKFLSLDKYPESKEEKQITTTSRVFFQEEFSQSGEISRRENEQQNMKAVPSRLRNNANETGVSQENITGNGVRNKRKITLMSETNSGAKRHKDVESTLNKNFKEKSIVIAGPDYTDRAARNCIFPKLSSTDASCSYDSPAVQEPSANHNLVLPFICKHCGKGFPHHSKYKIHVRSHTGEKPFACKLCDKRFASSYGLTRHNRVHTGERPFKCEYCDKRFADREVRKVHTRSHTGERPYVCRECNKRFINSANLKVHMRMHSGEKPYECEICGQRFSQKITLNIHEETH